MHDDDEDELAAVCIDAANMDNNLITAHIRNDI